MKTMEITQQEIVVRGQAQGVWLEGYRTGRA